MKRVLILGMAMLAAVNLIPITSKAAPINQSIMQGNRKIMILGNACNNVGKPEKPEMPKPENPEDEMQNSYEKRVVELVNKEREKAGLSPVVMGKELQKAAMKRAKEIQNSFSHTRPDGSNFITVLKEYNIQYKGAGENIAMGQKNPEEVVKAWMSSSGHRANILNKNFKNIGIGFGKDLSNMNYWVQLFTN